MEPDNTALVARAAEIDSLRAAGQPTVPAKLGLEKATNPFLRAHLDALKAAVDMAGVADAEVFAHIRQLKDRF